MALDPALEKAVLEATGKAGQPPAVGHRLVAWLLALSEGESSEDRDLSFYENVMSAIAVPGAPDAD